VDYYNQKKDEANTHKFLAFGKKEFPDDLFWPTLELDRFRETGPKDSLFSKYEEITTHFPKNHLFFFNYGLELYQYASDTTSGKRPANADELIQKAQAALKKCLELQPDYPQAALVLGQISYNAGVDLQAKTKTIKGTKPEDIKKRADLRIAAGKKFDEAIPYFEKVDQDLASKGKLKMDEKTTLKNTYDLLITIYEEKRIKDKAEAYTTKFNNVDKDH
jgi:tetratricopeptide (TPR) repeat protein